MLWLNFYIMQIVTGIEVNSEAYFLEYCPSAEGTRATEGNETHY